MFNYGNVIDKVRNDSVRYEVRTLHDNFGKLCEVPFAKDSCVYDKDNLLRSRVSYNSEGKIELSYMFYYSETGVRNGQSALGIEGRPIRCPNWEPFNFSYYKLGIIRDTRGIPIKYKVTNEFGEDSYLTDQDNSGFTIWYTDMNDYRIFNDTISLGAGITKCSSNHMALLKQPLPSSTKKSVYLHLTNITGLQSETIKDGDILIELGNWRYKDNASLSELFKEWHKLHTQFLRAKVLRLSENKYVEVPLEFPIHANEWTEYHIIYNTDSEYNKIYSTK